MNGLDLHHRLEKNLGLLIFGILFVTSIGGLVQILPSLFQSLINAHVNIRILAACLFQPASARGIGIKVIHKWNQIPKKRSIIVQKCVRSFENFVYQIYVEYDL